MKTIGLSIFVLLYLHNVNCICTAPYEPFHGDCSKFFECDSGDKVEKSCPDGLYWNQNSTTCDDQNIVQCPFNVTLSSSIEEIDNVCSTPGCAKTSSHVLERMDQTIKPCDDFYSFACGNFVKKTKIPDEKTSVNIFTITDEKTLQQLHSVISNSNDQINSNDSKALNMVQRLYKACMNKTLIEERGLDGLLNIIDKIGGWPVVKGDQWNSSEWSWQWAIKEFRKVGYGTSYIFDFFIGTDLKNSTSRIIYLDQAATGLSRQYLSKGFEEKIVKAYYEYMVDVAVIYGANRSQAEQELRESLEFEMDLANISLPNEERRNFTALYNPYTVREVQQMYPYVQWVNYINAILPAPLSIDENEIIVIGAQSYFDNLDTLLRNTPKRAVANYMMWRVVSFSTFYMTEELRERQLVYDTVISGTHAQRARWNECVNDIASGSLSIAVSALYVRKYFRQDSKAAALEMVNGIRKQFALILNETSWMDEQTRSLAIMKLDGISTFIGYPDELLDDSKIAKLYENLEIDENNYLQSILNLNIFSADYVFNSLRQPINKTFWADHSDATSVSAFYSAVDNSIQLPAGILQGQFFSIDRPRYMNFGAIGTVIGHELTHGFDDEGNQFDINGNLVDWWQSETKKQFLEKANCIIEQYGNYTETTTSLNLNGINSQGENIADNAGIKQAYLAYQTWVKENGAEQKLPGLEYTPQQMFWISAAQTWCSVTRPEHLKIQIQTDVHSPDAMRVLGPLSNREEFANDFNCPLGTPMNPPNKCQVW